MNYYAQTNEKNICIGISQLSGEVESPHMIEITEEQYATGDLIGKKYENGFWISVELPFEISADPIQELKDLQLLQLQIALETAEKQREANLLALGIALETIEIILGGE